MIVYLLKTVLCSGILLLAYYLLLQQEKMLRFNRFYLLFSLLFPFIVPFIHFSVPAEILLQPQVVATLPNAGILVNVTPENMPVATTLPIQKTAFNWWNIVIAIYVSGCLTMLIRFGKNLFQIIATIRKNKVEDHGSARLVLLNQPTVPYSFFHFIFLNKYDYENGLIQPEILCHEQKHVRQKHSLDILFIELLIAIYWFNPVLYCYRKSIRLNHEFLADEAVIKRFDNAPVYQQLLLQTAIVPPQTFLVSSFNYFITKKRFLMMTKNTSSKIMLAKEIFIFSLLTAAVFIFSTRTMAQIKSIPKGKQQDNSAVTATPPANEKEQNKKVLDPDYWTRFSIGHTEEGATAQQLQEYEAIINKYKTEDKWWHTFSKRVSEQDRSHLETIFKQMNFAQQNEQFLVFLKPFAAPAKSVPTREQFEAFKNPKVYGLWINDKHVNNTALSHYSNTDFSHFYVSKLYGPAKTGRSYTHQLDMMTNEYYQVYYNKTIANRKSPIGFVISNHPVDSIRQQFRDHSISQQAESKLKYNTYTNKFLFKTIPIGEGVSDVELDQYQNTLKRLLDEKGTSSTIKTSDNSEVLINRLARIYWRMNDTQRKQVMGNTEHLITSL